MFTPNAARLALILIASLAGAATGSAQTAGDTRLNLGAPLPADQLAGYFAIPPDGRGLPQGSGDAKAGRVVFAEKCAVCHGDKLEGNPQPGFGGDKLVGGRGSLATDKPVKTTESYWPYATTLFDYIKRAMPFNAPGSLTNDEVYAVVAFILAEGHIIGPDDKINAAELPKVKMPNRDGFIPDPRPELSLYK
ncbi:c-type cytochrome [Methylocella silvestris]|uniref:Cytochrome C n=1 Tax=Methylocella silvestris TaxID=199596 RepID=A0A2J7TKH5_METSI|nr:cytochrome c [Methylocella silvestris]PNG27272.1 cytochrome C [Methylocella silvestris]